MIVQEAGMAVGWPLGLGHDTTGWPLGLRLRLTQEDLQWPRKPPCDDSPTYSTNSSSLDTESTRSFFQDKSITLGKLIGLPTTQYPHASSSNNNSQPRRRNSRNTSSLRVFPTSSSSGSRSNSDRHHRRRSKSRSSSHCRSHGSNRPPFRSATSAGWALLSVLSCAKIPPVIEAGSKSSKSSSSSKSASRGGSELSISNPPEIPPGLPNSSTAGVPFMGRSPARARKLYDNITFEEEAVEHDGSHSSEWNPLFASSSLADDEDDDHDEDPDAVMEPLEPLRQSLMCNHSSRSRSSQASDWSSSSESCDKMKSSSASGVDHRIFSPFGKQSVVNLLLSRMICCRSTRTVET